MENLEFQPLTAMNENRNNLNLFQLPQDETSIFRKELEILRDALETSSSQGAVGSCKSNSDYRELCDNYARLLRQTIKLTKMGDVNQRRLMRLKTELEEQNAKIEAQKESLLVLNRKLEEASLTDPLTECKNRRFLNNALDDFNAWVKRWRVSDKPFPQNRELLLMLVDIDYFKTVNDLYGHKAGDLVLGQMAKVIGQQCREGDWLIRWGGEEFLVVARETNRGFGPNLAERLRKAVEAAWFETGNGQKIQKTCSIGFTHYPFFYRDEAWLDWELVLQLADQCLYAAKNTTRNAWVGMSALQEPPVVSDLNYKAAELVTQGLAQLHSKGLDLKNLLWI